MKIGTKVKIKLVVLDLFKDLPKQDQDVLRLEMIISDVCGADLELYVKDKNNSYHWFYIKENDVEICGYGGMVDTLV